MSGTWIILEVTMGLPLRERRKLRKIERAIARTEPRLTAMFSMFTCLNRVEAMPRLERVRNRVIGRAARARRAVTLKTNTA
jgi:phage shock protein A